MSGAQGPARSRISPEPHRLRRAAPRPRSMLEGFAFSLFPSHLALLSNSLEGFFLFFAQFLTLQEVPPASLLLSQLAVTAAAPCKCWVPVVQKMMEKDHQLQAFCRNPGSPAANLPPRA